MHCQYAWSAGYRIGRACLRRTMVMKLAVMKLAVFMPGHARGGSGCRASRLVQRWGNNTTPVSGRQGVSTANCRGYGMLVKNKGAPLGAMMRQHMAVCTVCSALFTRATHVLGHHPAVVRTCCMRHALAKAASFQEEPRGEQLLWEYA